MSCFPILPLSKCQLPATLCLLFLLRLTLSFASELELIVGQEPAIITICPFGFENHAASLAELGRKLTLTRVFSTRKVVIVR